MAARKKKKKPPLKKRLLKSGLVIYIASHLLALVLRLLYLTNRVTRRIPAAANPYVSGEKPALMCFWHGRLAMMPFMRSRRPSYVLISSHADGRLISAIIRRFAIGTVYGSSSKGFKGALEELGQVAQAQSNIAFTPDGPRGPFQKAAKGAAYVAINTRYPVVCLTYSATRHTRFKSWDKFMLPKPLGRVTFVASEPLFFPEGDSDEAVAAATQTIETTLNAITREADHDCGVEA